MKQFPAAVHRTKPIEFEIAGDVFHFTPPKLAGPALALLEPMDDAGSWEIEQLRQQMDWLGEGLAEGEADKLMARLRDPEDPLDLPVVWQVLEWLLAKVAGRPTRPSSGSPRRRG